MADLKDRKQLTEEWIQRFLSYTDEITWFGANSVMRAWAVATAILVEAVYQLFVALIRRFTLSNAAGDDLTALAAEHGVSRLGPGRSKALVIVTCQNTTVSTITIGGGSTGGDLIEVADCTFLLVGDSIRIRSQDGSVTDARTIIAIVPGAGTVGELDVNTLTGTYAPGSETVRVLIRVQVPAGTALTSSAGVAFETLTAVTTGDANPVFAGEAVELALADKTWSESVTTGLASNVDARAINSITAGPIRGVTALYNPEAATGGADEESDFALRYRAMHGPTAFNQETAVWMEALATQANPDVLRLIRDGATAPSTLSGLVLRRNGGTFSASELAAIETYMEARARSGLGVLLGNVTLTAVEVEATITLDPDYTLEEVHRAASSALASMLDFRKWEWGTDVDEADLVTIVNETAGVASLETSSFLPAANVAVGALSLPVLARLSLRDSDTGDTINADLAVGF
jgi:uncharacterized phage protein gp47/JayE